MSDIAKIGLSVVMPALNEGKNIAGAISDTLKAFEIFGICGEIVVVNDGSMDNTRTLVEQKIQEFPGLVRIINHDKPCGIGASFWDGVDNAQGGVVVMLPGDNENDPCEILRYYAFLEHVDMVIPFIFNREARPFLRNALSFLYRFIINTTFLVNFNYTNGTILYRRSILKELKSRSTGFFFQTDILIRSVKRGYLFAEVPYKVGIRKGGVSKAVTFPSFLNVVRGYLRLAKDCHFSKDKFSKDEYCDDSQAALRRAGNFAENGLSK